MFGLIEKDLRLTFARKQTLLIFFIMALVMGISMDGSFIVGYLTMLAAVISIGTISYDEYDNGFAFLMTLPFGRKTYVREKYLFCLKILLIVSLCVVITNAVLAGDNSIWFYIFTTSWNKGINLYSITYCLIDICFLFVLLCYSI